MSSRLKNLELHGYKTFASKTGFEFPGKITAIVGPNGSGKSNVADAIRWVLGEQSYRLLRGRKTEDMIFIGSETRSRAGMASATITFDNEDGWLPIDFSEVSVTRRAYRDGQNEYLLNGQRIRLRDIQELLAQSGLAERTYTLIGQGLVDTALSVRPEERRKFFEEAAGIGLYRSRREEAVVRLDQTRRNLERVRDILSELEPRLKSLERQSRRFIEYKTIQADLQELLREWYGFHWHLSQDELSASRKLVKERESELEKAREVYEQFDRKISELRKDLHEVRTQLNIWHSESSALHQKREQISKDLAVLDERQRSMLNQKQNGLSDIVRTEEEINDRLRSLQVLKNEWEQLTSDYKEATAQLEKSQQAVSLRQSERTKIENDVRKTRNELLQKQTRRVELNARKSEIEDREKSLQDNQTAIIKDQEIAAKNLESTRKNYDQIQAQDTDSNRDREELESIISGVQKEIQKLEEDLRRNQKELSQTQSEEGRISAQLNVLEQAESSFSGYNTGSKTILSAAKSGKLSGKFKPLSEFLNIPGKYEAAMTAALGEFVDAIVLQGHADTSETIHLLSLENNGRAAILPIALLKADKIQSVPKGEQVIGNYSELCHCDDEINPVLNTLLGNTVFVEDTATALRLMKKINNQAKIVTMAGEVFYGNGMVVAGKENRSSIIARPRQKKELVDSLKNTRESTSKFQLLINQTEEKLSLQRDKLSNERTKLQKHDQEIQGKTRLVHQANLAFEQARQKSEYLSNQLTTVQDQLHQNQKTLAVLEKEIDNAQVVIKDFQSEIDKANALLRDVPVEELQADLFHWRTNTAVAERAAADALKRLQQFEQLIQQGNQRKISLQRRTEDLETNLSEVEEQKASLRAQEEGIQEQIEELRQRIQPAEIKLADYENVYSGLQEDQTNAQQGVSIAERHYSQCQLDYSRSKDALGNLQRRIEEDFGLVAFEYSSSISGPNPLPFEGLVQQLPRVAVLEPTLEQNISRQRAQLRRIGPINPDADEEYRSVKERFEFMTTQVNDLNKADEDLRQVIGELDELMQREFKKTFDAVAIEFKDMFTQLFGGGSAKLLLTDEEDFNNSGIDIEARLPGRREQGLSLLSGGERSLTAVALIFALLKVSPTPFCVLDEVDAALDESNVGRFCDLLIELSKNIQFIVITHNRNTVQVADVIYGITMGRDSTSQMISLRMDEINEEMVK